MQIISTGEFKENSVKCEQGFILNKKSLSMKKVQQKEEDVEQYALRKFKWRCFYLELLYTRLHTFMNQKFGRIKEGIFARLIYQQLKKSVN